ncbi:MAG: hypothetical protein Q8880_05830, partial [Bacteroidota bacterium]|nr:hypothetical protein [Bacteroidota bacterium]
MKTITRTANLILILALFFSIQLKSFSQTYSVGDYRTNGQFFGNWSDLSQWEKCTIAGNPGTWVAATTLPSTTSNVYITNGTFMYIDQDETCKNLTVQD